MGVLPPRRRDSQLGLASSSTDWPHDPPSCDSDIPVEHANQGSSPPDGLGIEPSIHGGPSFRTPSRSFYHRSFHNSLGNWSTLLVSSNALGVLK